MKRLIVHPGSPKTATSTLQNILRVNRNVLRKQKVGLILPDDIRGKGFFVTYMKAYREGKAADVRGAWDKVLEPFVKEFDTILISEETLCLDFMPSRIHAQGGIDRSERAAELIAQSGFASHDIVMTIRPQLDFLTSTYTHFVHRQQERRPFEEWLAAEVALDKVNWVPAVRAFRQTFGSDHVRVVSMARTKAGGIQSYLEEVLGALGLNVGSLTFPKDEVRNPSASARAVDLCRIMNAEIRNPEKSRKVNSFLIKTFPVSEFGRFSPTWTPPAELAQGWDRDHEAALGA